MAPPASMARIGVPVGRRADDGRGDQRAGDEAVDAEHDAEQPLADEARQQAPAEQEHGGRQLVGGGEHGPIIDAAARLGRVRRFEHKRKLTRATARHTIAVVSDGRPRRAPAWRTQAPAGHARGASPRRCSAPRCSPSPCARPGWTRSSPACRASAGVSWSSSCCPGLRLLVRAWAWTLCTPAAAGLRVRDTFPAFLTGDALGNLTPLGLFASEATKAVYVRHRVPLATAVSGLTIENLIYTMTVAVVIVSGTLALLHSFRVSHGLEVVFLVVGRRDAGDAAWPRPGSSAARSR